MEQPRLTVLKQWGARGIGGDTLGEPADADDDRAVRAAGESESALNQSLNSSLRSTTDILNSVEKIVRLISNLVAERDRMVHEIERIRREREDLLDQLRQLKIAAESETADVRELARREREALEVQLHRLRLAAEAEAADVREQARRERGAIADQLRQIKIAAEIEAAEMRERAREESQAILAEAQLIRAEALGKYARLEERLAAAESSARNLVRELLSYVEAVEDVRDQLEASPAVEADVSVRQRDLGGTSLAIEADVPVRPRDGWGLPPEKTRAKDSPESQGSGKWTLPEGDGPGPLHLEKIPKTSTEQVQPRQIREPVGVDARPMFTAAVADASTDREPFAKYEAPVAPTVEPSGPRPAQFLPLMRYRLLIHPVRGFGKIVELEKGLGEIHHIESIQVIGWRSHIAAIEVDARGSRDDLLCELADQKPNLRVVRADEAEIELELVEPRGQR